MIGLWQFLCMCKAEKTQLNDRVAIGGVLCSTNCSRQSTKDRNLKIALFERQLIKYVIQSIQTSLEILCREPIKINDSRHNYGFIGGTLKLCNACNVIGGQNYFFQKI